MFPSVEYCSANYSHHLLTVAFMTCTLPVFFVSLSSLCCGCGWRLMFDVTSVLVPLFPPGAGGLLGFCDLRGALLLAVCNGFFCAGQPRLNPANAHPHGRLPASVGPCSMMLPAGLILRCSRRCALRAQGPSLFACSWYYLFLEV